MSVALTCSRVNLTAKAVEPDRPVPPPQVVGRDAKLLDKEDPPKTVAKLFGEIDEKMFPDGRCVDFGKVPRGMQVKHAFRIVNTSNVPIQIVSVRHS